MSGSSEIVRVLRAYPTPADSRWLYLLLETLADLESVTTRTQLADVVARRSREIFGDVVRGTVLVIRDDELYLIPSTENVDVPPFPEGSPVTLVYAPGIIFEISEFETYQAQRPSMQPWYRAGYRYIVSAAYGPRSHTQGYISILHREASEYSDDELTLLAILGTFVGITLDRIDLGALPQPPGPPAPLPTRRLVTTLRTYPKVDHQPWLYMLLESIADFVTAMSREELTEVVAMRSRALFGGDVCAMILLRGTVTNTVEVVRSPSITMIPPMTGMATLVAPYFGGQIIEITDVLAYCKARPGVMPWYEAGVRYVLGAAFSPRSKVQGYLNFLHTSEHFYTENELSLLSIFATVAGFGVARVDASAKADPTSR